MIYHIWNRGVDGRPIFIDDRDRKRFLRSLDKFNTDQPVRLNGENFYEVAPRKKQVAIFAYTLLDNHFHISLKELEQGGFTKFSRKLGTGYTLYFNKTHDRRGRLFERKIQSKKVTNDQYFQHLIAYIHLNVLDMVSKDWRAGHLSQAKKLDLLLRYRWSSARAYLGNFSDPLVDFKELSLHYPMDSFKQHKKYLLGWSKRNFDEVAPREKERRRSALQADA